MNWDQGTFTGELLVGTDLVLFENYIVIDGTVQRPFSGIDLGEIDAWRRLWH